MFLELVSIIINCIFFSSILLLYHISHASLRRVGKLRLWHVALNIATAKDYGIPLSPSLSQRLLMSNLWSGEVTPLPVELMGPMRSI